MSRRAVPWVALLAAAIAAGCAGQTSYLKSDDFQERSGSLKKVGVMVAEARILHVHAGSESTPDDAASEVSAALSEAAVKQLLAERGYAVLTVARDDESRALLADYIRVRKDVLAAYSPGSGTIRGVPPLAGAAAVAARNGVDGIVFVGAWGDDAPAGRRIVFGDMAVFRIFFGKGTACADLSAIDRTGALIYYGRESGDSCSLTEHDGVHKIFGDLVAGLPPAGGKRGE